MFTFISAHSIQVLSLHISVSLFCDETLDKSMKRKAIFSSNFQFLFQCISKTLKHGQVHYVRYLRVLIGEGLTKNSLISLQCFFPHSRKL